MNPIQILINSQANLQGFALTQGAISNLQSALVGFAARLTAIAGAALSVEKAVSGIFGSINRADEAGKLAQKLGMTVEEFTRLSSAVKLSNVDVSEFRVAIKELSEWMIKVGRGGDSVTQVLLDWADKFAQMPDGAQKTALAMQVFGRSGQSLIPLLNQGSEAIQRQMRESHGLGVVIGKDFARNAEQFNDNMSLVKLAVQGVFNQFAEALLPALNKFSEKLVEAGKNASAFAELLVSEFQAGRGPEFISLSIQAGFSLGLKAAVGLWQSFWETAAPAAAKYIPLGILTAINEVMKLLGSAVAFLFRALDTFAAVMASDFQNAIDRIKAAFQIAFVSIGNFLRAAIEGAVNAVIATLNKISSSPILRLLAAMNHVTLPGQLYPVSLGREAVPAMPARGSAVTWSEAWETAGEDAAMMDQAIKEFFNQSTQAARDLLGVNGDLSLLASHLDSAYEVIKAKIEEIRAKRLSDANDGVGTRKKGITGLENDIKGLGDVPNKSSASVEQPSDVLFGFKDNFIAGINEMWTAWQDFGANFARLSLTTIQGAIDGISDSIAGLIMGTKNAGQAALQMAQNFVAGIIKITLQWIASRLMQSAVDKLASKSEAAAKAPSALLSSISSFGIAAAVGAAAFLAAMALTGGFGGGREHGGPVTAGNMYLVGERRPELFVPSQNGTILPNTTAATGSAAGANVKLAFFGGEADAKRWAESQEGQVWFVNMATKTLHQFTGRA